MLLIRGSTIYKQNGSGREGERRREKEQKRGYIKRILLYKESKHTMCGVLWYIKMLVPAQRLPTLLLLLITQI